LVVGGDANNFPKFCIKLFNFILCGLRTFGSVGNSHQEKLPKVLLMNVMRRNKKSIEKRKLVNQKTILV
jgi:hypothetical protein